MKTFRSMRLHEYFTWPPGSRELCPRPGPPPFGLEPHPYDRRCLCPRCMSAFELPIGHDYVLHGQLWVPRDYRPGALEYQPYFYVDRWLPRIEFGESRVDPSSG